MPCALCPRRCPSSHFCGRDDDPLLCVVSKTMLHRWEEPCVSGAGGSGAVFFAGCNLRCVFCQNYVISSPRPLPGQRRNVRELCDLFWQLHEQGAENINLVSPTHFLPAVRAAMHLARAEGFPLPFIWNSNAYELTQPLRTLEGLVDLYLPDLKYHSNTFSQDYSNAPNYFEYASHAILEMHRQTDVLIRHMILPGCRHDSLKILDWIAQNAPRARLSLLAQYTPMAEAAAYPANHPLRRRLTSFEYQSVADHALELGLQGYFQERNSATAIYTPDF